MKESPSGLKQHTLISLSFWGPRIWVQLSWVLWLHVCPSAAVITGLDLGGSASTLAHMPVRRTQVLMGCWTEGSVPCWLLAGHRPQFLALRASPWCSPQHGSQSSSERARRRAGGSQEPESLLAAHHFSIFCLLEGSPQVQPTLMEGSTWGCVNQELGSLAPSQKLPTIWAITCSWLCPEQKRLTGKCLYFITQGVCACFLPHLLTLSVMLKKIGKVFRHWKGDLGEGCDEGGNRLENKNQGSREKWEPIIWGKVCVRKLEFLLKH